MISCSEHSWPLLATVSPQASRLRAYAFENFDVVRNAVLFFFDIHVLQKAAKGYFTFKLVGNDLSSQVREVYRILPQLSPAQAVMIVDDSFNYHARLNTNYHALSSTIIDYHAVWTCSNST